MSTSRLRGLRGLSVDERRVKVSAAIGVPVEDISRALGGGGLDVGTADKCVENVLGTYALPFGVVLNVCVNGRDHVVPTVVEEPSVIAAASNAAKMIRAGGGFTVEVDPPIMIAQVQILDVPDATTAKSRILAARDEILGIANAAAPGLVAHGGGARELELRSIGEPGDEMMVAHILVDCRDAMGANLVNTIAEATGYRLAALAGGRFGLRIVSNLCDRRCVRVACRVPKEALAVQGMSHDEVIDGIVNASRFAELDPYRAATHNKGIMNGIDGVVVATGNDWRAVEAGAHAYAARDGVYRPLSIWRRDADCLVGRLALPMALGVVGGTLRVHDAARLAVRIAGVKEAAELSGLAASVGLASNLAAIRALSTVGIQRGHMALHARAVALAAGAKDEEVQQVAMMMVKARDITLDGAKRALTALAEPAVCTSSPSQPPVYESATER